MYDLVVRGGFVVDGTGAPGFEADVAVSDGLVVAVGKGLGAGRREIDARGKLVTPGFVDMHTHYDAQVTWDPYLSPSGFHGCTTVVMGNCGVGFAPVKPDRHDWLIGLMEGVEDIPGAALHEGIQWAWESFPEYLDALEKTPHAIDFGTQVTHGALRAYVMGERGAANEEATPEDIAAMAALVREGIRAGALGFSTSRTSLHKSITGELVPGSFATREEIFGIGRVLGEEGRGVFQMAVEHLHVPREFAWMRDLAKEVGRPVIFSLSQTDQGPGLWREVLGMLEGAAAEGLPVYGQVAGRAIGIIMGWECTAHPFATCPVWWEVFQMPREERLGVLSDPGYRARLLADVPMEIGAFETFVTTSYHKMFLMGADVNYEPAPEESVAAIAAKTGRGAREIAYDHMMSEGGKGKIYFPLFNYSDGDLELLRGLHMHPQTRMGLSDGGAHCGAICDGGMPTFMLTHWTRDRRRGERLPLEWVVRRQTSETARTYGMEDRGVLAAGMKGDINVIDYERLGFGYPEVVYDLPAGGRRLMQGVEGYVATICSGEVVFEHGQPTGAMPGRLIRGPQRRRGG